MIRKGVNKKGLSLCYFLKFACGDFWYASMSIYDGAIQHESPFVAKELVVA